MSSRVACYSKVPIPETESTFAFCDQRQILLTRRDVHGLECSEMVWASAGAFQWASTCPKFSINLAMVHLHAGEHSDQS